MKKFNHLGCIALASMMVTTPAPAMDFGSQKAEEIKTGLYPGVAYSPYAKRSFPSNAY